MTQETENTPQTDRNGTLTIIQTPEGEAYGCTTESPEDAFKRLSRAFLCQRIGNVVRMVRPLKLRRVE